MLLKTHLDYFLNMYGPVRTAAFGNLFLAHAVNAVHNCSQKYLLKTQKGLPVLQYIVPVLLNSFTFYDFCTANRYI